MYVDSVPATIVRRTDVLFQKRSYARIIRENYLVMASMTQRPHVIGLTASPTH